MTTRKPNYKPFVTLVLFAMLAPACTAAPAHEERVGTAEQAIIGPDYVAVLDAQAVPTESGPLLVQYDEVSAATRKLALKGEPYEIYMRFDYLTNEGVWQTQYATMALVDATWLGDSGQGTSYVVASVPAQAKPDWSMPIGAWAQIIGPNLPPPGIIGPNEPGIIGPN